jgi:N-acetylglutamate synthase-like GNAT family acetyltransferase
MKRILADQVEDLHSLVVHTEHRYRGAGKMLIRWGIAKADELGVETVVSSLPSARGAYEKSGLGYIEVIPPDESLNVENPSEKWKQLQADDLSGFLMWRPIGHDYVEGVDKAPWL